MSADELMRWEILEDWLFRRFGEVGGSFVHREVMAALELDGETATDYIQAYLEAQRAKRMKSKTLYMLYREGRTSTAVWHVGIRTKDGRAHSHQYFDDTQNRWKRSITPDLNHLAERNPRAKPAVERVTAAVGNHAMELLRIAVGGSVDDDDDDGPAGMPVA